MKITKNLISHEIHILTRNIHILLSEIASNPALLTNGLEVVLYQKLRQLEGMSLQFEHCTMSHPALSINEVYQILKSIKEELEEISLNWQQRIRIIPRPAA